VTRLVFTTLLTGLLGLHIRASLASPELRGQRGLVSVMVFVLGVPSLYLLFALLRRIWWEQLGSRWWWALFTLLSLVGPPVLAALVDEWGNAAELAKTRQMLAPFVGALQQEQGRLGHPAQELEPLLVRHLPDPRSPYLRTRFHYFPGRERFGLAVGVTAPHRDDESYAWFSSADGSWRWIDAHRSGTRVLPPVEGAPDCRCSHYGQWVCEPPCGRGLQALENESPR
jgi:hypothetical protein